MINGSKNKLHIYSENTLHKIYTLGTLVGVVVGTYLLQVFHYFHLIFQKPKDEMNGDTSGRESKQKKKRKKKLKPIERDDFPAPPFPYARRRHWSEPLRSSDR